MTFTEPALCHYNHDLSKSWFVYFDVTENGKTIRKQFRGGINYWPDKINRLKDGNALVKMWKTKLHSGLYNPFGAVRSTEMPKNIREAIERVYELKKATLKEKSVRGYKDIKNRFLLWCQSKRFDMLPVYTFSKNIAQAYCDYLIIDRKFGGKTHNNHIGVLRAFFNVIKKRWPQLLNENPFLGIDMLPVDVGGNVAYTLDEREKLIKYFKENNLRMYYAVQFLFHCFIRKTELSKLKVGDIDWDNGTITINSESAKNRNQDSVTIPEGLYPILYDMGLNTAPKHFYIFGYGLETVEEKINKPDNLSDLHMRLKAKAGFLKYDGKSFYSWKHTGVIAYWSVIKDPYYMMRQLRHSDLKTTMVYMKSLGLMPNDAFKNAKILL